MCAVQYCEYYTVYFSSRDQSEARSGTHRLLYRTTISPERSKFVHLTYTLVAYAYAYALVATFTSANNISLQIDTETEH